MARTTIVPDVISRAGQALGMVAAPAVDLQFLNTGTEVLAVEIATGSVNVSLPISKKVDGITPDPKVVAVAAGDPVLIGPFPTGIYNQAGDLVHVDLSATADVTLNVLRLAGVREE